jgi:hypothetical protein
MTTVNAIARPFSGSAAVREAITEVITTVIGPVGSDIKVAVPPNSAAKKPIKIAPHNPADAPAPEATPKVKAIGKAITAAVTPPKISPFTFLK